MQNCEDTKLEVGFGVKNHEEIKDEIQQIVPKGTTLIAYSLQQSAYDFPTDKNSRNIIILITDGIEECQGDPCAVSQVLQRQGVILKPFIIGLGSEEEFQEQFACVGKFFEANSEESFEKVLEVVISQALNNTTCQVNLLDKFGKPTETDINISFYDATTKIFLSNVIHTINRAGLPDTIYLNPAQNYDIIVHTIPPLKKENVEIVAGKHTTITFDAPQGSLGLVIDGYTTYGTLSALITPHGEDKFIHVQTFNTTEPYLIGTYDIEILTLPRIRQENIQITQSKKTTIQIRQPGKLNLITRTDYVGDIFQVKGGDLVWVCNVEVSSSNNIIVMQPGDYMYITRLKREQNTIKSREIKFAITSGKITNINL
jgi:Ca-activated chloride channel family protein